jgi:predicted homoserine dehydrogenase-like protein
MAGPVCEVVTVAKRELKAGEPIDGIGGFCVYGLIDNSAAARAIAALPIALSEGSVMRHDVSKDQVLSFADVVAPAGRLTEALWKEQTKRWPVATSESKVLSKNVPVANL